MVCSSEIKATCVLLLRQPDFALTASQMLTSNLQVCGSMLGLSMLASMEVYCSLMLSAVGSQQDLLASKISCEDSSSTDSSPDTALGSCEPARVESCLAA